ncbi:MAG: hypothetical protein CML31_13105 [Rhizobiales bacterium]|nr:hypothetical protein [Hyphomicrobiales bacterium]
MTPLLTPEKAAEMLGISVRHLADLVGAGEIPFVPVGNGSVRQSRRYDPHDLEAYVGAKKCRHTEGRPRTARSQRNTPTTSGSEVVDIQEILAQRRSAKRTASNRSSSARPARGRNRDRSPK